VVILNPLRQAVCNLKIAKSIGFWSFRIMGNVDTVAWRRLVVRYSVISARREQLH
jgi:hypothetical protein